jgi:hypothetical protein
MRAEPGRASDQGLTNRLRESPRQSVPTEDLFWNPSLLKILFHKYYTPNNLGQQSLFNADG